jgi:hypothetical protein
MGSRCGSQQPAVPRPRLCSNHGRAPQGSAFPDRLQLSCWHSVGCLLGFRASRECWREPRRDPTATDATEATPAPIGDVPGTPAPKR